MKLKYWRQEAGLNQFELAQVSGVSRAIIQLVEQNRRGLTPDELQKIIAALGLSKKELKGLKVQHENN